MTRFIPRLRRSSRLGVTLPPWIVALLVVIPLAVGCAGIPTGTAPEVVRKVADQAAAAAPQGPEAGQQPEQIVREFVHALAMTDFDTAGESFVVARQYLADPEGWDAGSGTTQIVVLADDFATVPDPEDASVVTLSARQVGLVDEDRSYLAVNSRPYHATLHLDRTADGWRISDPPDVVLITQSDFGTALRQRTVYFLDSTGRVVVPDIRYIPNSHTPDLSASRLMDLLLRGPSSRLAGAARTALGPGAQLISNLHIDESGVAHVDLDGVDISTPAARQALAAQIVWTLDPDVGQIAISVNGIPLDISGGDTSDGEVFSLASGTVANFDPDTVPGSAQAVSDAYYVDGGVVLRLSDSSPMWGSVGTGSVQVRSAALSAASGALAAVIRDSDGGAELLVGRPFDHQPTTTVLKAATLTPPTFTRWGYAAWTVQNGASKPEVYQVSITSGTPTWTRVSAPELNHVGQVTALSLSPDGVRAAVVAGGKLYLAAVAAPDEVIAGESDTRPGDDPRGPRLVNLQILRGDLTDVGPVTWDDSTSLLVGAKIDGSRHRTVFEVSVDGQSVDAITTSQILGDVFGDVDAIASSTSTDQPMLISFGGRLWQLQGNPVTGQWVPPDGRNWMPGTMPFYPR